VDLVIEDSNGTSDGMNLSMTITQGTNGTLTFVGGAEFEYETVSSGGVQGTDHDDPTDLITQQAADPGASWAGILYSDVLTGGDGGDSFAFITSATGQNMLTDNVFDTVKDLNLDEDKVGLSFDIDTIVTGSILTGASLGTVVQELFADGGAFHDVENAAGLFTFSGETYLVMSDQGGDTFGTDDVIAKVTNYVGALGTSDFYLL
jgi:hypothetical protein